MSASWLDQLAPEHAPLPPPWWPPALGWWAVVALCLLAPVLVLAWRHFYRRARRGTARSAALLELRRIRTQAESDVAGQIQRLLRRYALTVFGPDRVAPLTGEAWLDFLTRHGGERFAGEDGRAMLRAAYGMGAVATQREAWLAAAEAFIRRASRRRAERTP
jgi:Domain of unknown function (DUF4381)